MAEDLAELIMPFEELCHPKNKNFYFTLLDKYEYVCNECLYRTVDPGLANWHRNRNGHQMTRNDTK